MKFSRQAKRSRLIGTVRAGGAGAALLGILALRAAAPAALADDWDNPGTGDWFDDANWADGSVPTAGDTASINDGGTVQVQDPGAQANGLQIGRFSGRAGFLEILSGGTVSNGRSTLGGEFGATGTARVDGAGSTWIGTVELRVGNSGDGTLTITNGGTASHPVGILGFINRSTGTATVDGAGSTWTNSSSTLYVGLGGDGTLSIADGGTVNISAGAGTLMLGRDGGDGTLNLGSGGAAGVLNAATVNGGLGASSLNFNHTDADYFLTTDGTAGGDAIDITGTTAVNHLGTGTTTLTGVYAYTGGTTVRNGTLTVDAGSISHAGANATAGEQDGDNATLAVTNGGTLSSNLGLIGSAAGSTGAATVDGAGSTWTNSGAVYVGDSGDGTLTITDSGAVSNSVGLIGNSATSTGTVTVDGADSTWTNDNLYVGYNGDGTLGITDGGAVSNNYGFIASNAGSTGAVTVDGADSTWTNRNLYVGSNGDGTLSITDGGAVNSNNGIIGFTASSTGTLTLTSGGTLSINGGARRLTLANTGGSTGTLNIGAHGTGGAAGIVNAVSVLGGSGSATLNFNHTDADYVFTNDGTAGGDAVLITGTTAVNHLGSGTTTLSGAHTYTGATTVDAGTLFVNGSITASTTTVNAGGILGGSGSLSDVIMSGGTLSPGNSIGTLSVAGNYNHDSDSILLIEVNEGGNTPGVNNDLLAVTGTATINGGTVQVVAEPGSHVDGTEYTFLTADGGVTGTFDSITSNLFTAELGYLANSAFFTLTLEDTDYAALGQSGGQRAVGRTIDELIPSATGDLAVLFDELGGLNDANARSAIQQLSGETAGAGSAAVVQATTSARGTVFNRIRPTINSATLAGPATSASTGQPLQLASANEQDVAWLEDLRPASEWIVWVQGYGERGDVAGSAAASGFDYWAGGMLVGADRRVDEHWLLGAYGGYARSGVDSDHGQQNLDIDHYQLGLYSRYDRDDWYGLGSLFAGYQRYDAERHLRFGGIDRQADSDYDGGQFGAALELGRIYEVTDWTIQPLAGLQYVFVHRESYTESGAGAANLQVGSQDTDSLQSSLGVNLSRPIFEQADANALLHLRARWNYEFLDDSVTTTARFAGTSADTFTVDSASRGRHSAQLGAGVSWQLNETASLGLQYDAAFNHNFVTHSGAATLSFAW